MSHFDPETLQDITLVCSDCEKDFVFSTEEQIFFHDKNFTPPVRCKDCRKARKERKLQQGDRHPERQARRR